MAGSPTYTVDADLTNTYGLNETIWCNISIANSSATYKVKVQTLQQI